MKKRSIINLKKRDNSILGKLIFFLIWPFGSFLYSVLTAKTKSSQVIFYLFFILFGWSFIAEIESRDSFRYVQEFKSFSSSPVANYIDTIINYVTLDSSVKDIYAQTAYLLASIIAGNNYHLLLALFAAVFGFFYVKSLGFMLNNKEFDYSIPSVFVVACFALSNPIFNINGVRYWTAAWVFCFACFSFFVSNDRKLIFLILITPLIHIAFIIPVALFWIYYFFAKSYIVLIICYGLSFFIGGVSELLLSKQSLFPPVIQNMIESYTGMSVSHEGQNWTWYGEIAQKFPYYYLNILVIFLLMNLKYIKSHKMSNRIMMFVLVLFSFVNVTMSIPSLGGRLYMLIIPFLMFLCLIWKNRMPNLIYLIYLIPIAFIRPVYIWFFHTKSVSDPILYISNFFHIIIKNS